MNEDRVKKLNFCPDSFGNLLYWMNREQRVYDNWALEYAMDKAKEYSSRLYIALCLVPDHSNVGAKQFGFMLQGLNELVEKLRKLNIPFILLEGQPHEQIPKIISDLQIKSLVTDFDPLKITRKRQSDVADNISIPFYEVDSHNIIPCRIASEKQEYSARTIRQKIIGKLDTYLDCSKIPEYFQSNDLEESISFCIKSQNRIKDIHSETNTSYHISSGENSALNVMNGFIDTKLGQYNFNKNIPELSATSNLSPYLHFGQISAQRIVTSVLESHLEYELKSSFLDELIVRKELADNFCFYNHNYDNFDGFPEWAKKTLNKHRNDKREFLYSMDILENASTHDDLWNSAQKELTNTYRMHGYLRMYWAKKILEWTATPEEAISTSIYLNDKYQLDGNDPNGYTGIAWSIGGVHDRPWFERPVFGLIRYMSYNSQIKKINLEKYNSSFNTLF